MTCSILCTQPSKTLLGTRYNTWRNALAGTTNWAELPLAPPCSSWWKSNPCQLGEAFFGAVLPCWLVNVSCVFLSQSGQLNEYTERKEMSADVVCMSLANVPPGEQRSRFLAVGLVDNTVRIISLDPSVSSCAVCPSSIGLKCSEGYSRGGLCPSKLSFRIQVDDQELIACTAFLCWLGGSMALDPNL